MPRRLRKTMRLVVTSAILAGLGAQVRRLASWRSPGSADTWPPVPLAPRPDPPTD